MNAYAVEGDSTAVATGTDATTTQPADGAEGASPSFFDSPMMLVGLGAVWIYLIYSMRKNKKKQKAAKEKLNELKKGNKIITIGRIHGTIVKLTDDTFTIKPDNKSDFTLTFDRSAIMTVIDENAKEGDKPEVEEGVAEKIEQK